LKKWEPVVYANKNWMMGLAPDLVKHNNTYFLYGHAVEVMTAPSMSGPWSSFQKIEGVDGIDPGILTANDGSRYLYVSGGNYYGLSEDGLSVTSERMHVYDGWSYPGEWTVECHCLESPKLMYKDGYYYLISAEGGTTGPATSHMIVVARSREPTGPWTNDPDNPLVHTYTESEEWWSRGHGSLVEGPEGNWYVIYHGYLNSFRTLGRQVLIQPIEWTDDGWIKIAEQWPDGWDNAISMELPTSDEFDGTELGVQWRFYNTDPTNKTQLEGGVLTVTSNTDNVFPIGVTAVNTSYEIETNLTIESGTAGGLMLYYTHDAYFGIGLGNDGKIELFNQANTTMSGTADWDGTSVRLRITNDSNVVRCYYMDESGEWTMVGDEPYDVMDFNTTVYGGYGVMRPGVFTAGAGKVMFEYFRYTGGSADTPVSRNFGGPRPVSSADLPEISLMSGRVAFRNLPGPAAEILLIDPQGKTVYRRVSERAFHMLRLPPDMPAGIYLVRVTGGRNAVSKKIAVFR